jgi:hypothetical protein
MRRKIWVAALALFWSVGAAGGEADVVEVDVMAQGEGRYTFSVAVRHADEGWEHYADAWEVVAPDGTVLGTRTLYHPHVGEQPFTRSLSGVLVPAGVREVNVRAHDKVHGLGGAEMRVKLP